MVRRRVLAVGVLMLLGSAGCGESPEPGPAPAATTPGVSAAPSGAAPSAPAPSAPAPTAAFEVRDRKVIAGPRRVEVALGSQVVLEVVVDAADELHVHGYDRTAAVAPGRPTRMVFTANIPGVFEVELHSGVVLSELRVR